MNRPAIRCPRCDNIKVPSDTCANCLRELRRAVGTLQRQLALHTEWMQALKTVSEGLETELADVD